MTMLGLNFGTRNYTPTLMTADTACITTSWATSTKVLCMSGGFKSAPRSLQMTLANLVGTAQEMFTIDAPTLSQHYYNTPHSGQATLTMFGFNFGIESGKY